MHFAYLVTYRSPSADARISKKDYAAVVALLESTPKLKRALVYTPETATDFYTSDGSSPTFALQLDFASLEDLEANIAAGGHLQALASDDLTSLRECDVEQQAMTVRPFPVIDPVFQVADGELPCSFLVHYPGQAEDFGAWINYYLTHHPQIMRFFPGVREIEIFMRVDWLDAMPWRRVNYMQRNKLVYDSPAALTAANHSDVRHKMRADYEKFPPFTGSNLHFPMSTLTIEK